MHSLSVQETKVSYITKGNGPGLVLLHGTNSDSSSFAHIIDRFTDHRKVIVPDYAGCGQSTIPKGKLELDLLIEQIAAVIKDVSIYPVDLVGTSLGAVVAATVAATYPDLVRRLVLVSGFASADDPRHHMILETLLKLEDIDPQLSRRIGAALAFSPQFLVTFGDRLNQLLDRPSQPHIKERFDLDARIDIHDQLSKITAPTLVVGATYDYLVPTYHSHKLHQGIKDSHYAEVPSGHVAFFEKPNELVTLIRDFILKIENA